MTPFHDYSYYLQVVERNVKDVGHKLLHENYEVEQNISDIMRALGGLLVWVEDVQQKP